MPIEKYLDSSFGGVRQAVESGISKSRQTAFRIGFARGPAVSSEPACKKPRRRWTSPMRAIAFAVLFLPVLCFSKEPSMVNPADMTLRASWVRSHITVKGAELPFSFKVGHEDSTLWLNKCAKTTSKRKLSASKIQRTDVWTEKASGLQLRMVTVEYKDFPTVEWTLYFRNTGTEPSEIVSDICAIDVSLESKGQGRFVVHRTVGDGVEGIYSPDPVEMNSAESRTFAPFGGRPSSNEFPYFNVESPEGGMIVAIGWPGQWSAKFDRTLTGINVKAGQEKTRFRVLPGEELRSPLIAVQFWSGDRIESQNVWRRWMLAHNTPRVAGRLPSPKYNLCNANSYGYFGFTEADQWEWLKRYDEEKLYPEYLWIDLCWFKMDPQTLVYNGLYDNDPVRFPRGLKPLSDALHSKGSKLIVWFEPEHLYPGPENWHVANHPEWLLKVAPGRENEINQGMPLKDRMVYNLGHPAALKWLIENTDRVIKREGIDVYRHDFNVEPLTFWRENDAPDRQGVTEIKYVAAFLAYFDELLKRNPGLEIDNCASGGRRNDIEPLRRSLPLLRSDTWGEPTGQQCQTYGLAQWIPYWGTGIMYSEPKDLPYIFRSQMGPSFTSCWDLRPKANYDLHREIIRQWKSVRDLILLGDYYPLTPYSASNDVWMAWHFYRPETGEGIVQAFRRPNAKEGSIALKLKGLEPSSSYVLNDIDTGKRIVKTARELMEKGLKIDLDGAPQSALLTIQKQKR